MAATATTRWALTADVEKTRLRQRPLAPLQVEGLPPATLPLTVQAKKEGQGQFHACVKKHSIPSHSIHVPPGLRFPETRHRRRRYCLRGASRRARCQTPPPVRQRTGAVRWLHLHLGLCQYPCQNYCYRRHCFFGRTTQRRSLGEIGSSCAPRIDVGDECVGERSISIDSLV